VRRRLAGLAAVAAALCGCGGSADAEGASVVKFKVGGLRQVAVVPPGGGHGLVLFLYGRGGHASDQLGNQRFFSALARAGEDAPVFVFAQSDDASYWHDRRERRWGTFLWRRVLPEARRRFGVDAGRMAVGGISMGGFGAFDLARLHPGRFCAPPAPRRARGRATCGSTPARRTRSTPATTPSSPPCAGAASRSPSTAGRAVTMASTGRPTGPPTSASTPGRCATARDHPPARSASTVGTMTPIALVQEFVVALAGLGFVSLVTALFVLIAKVVAPRLLDKDDGSSY
jgi:poly(3-hydroxybutyrate) depolymerase